MANTKDTKNEIADKKEMMVTYQVNGEEVTLTPNTVRDYLTRGNTAITGQEAVLFMNLCKYQQLNPFLGEAYLVKFGDKPAEQITGKSAFEKRAESHEMYDGYKAGLIIARDKEVIEVEGSFCLKTDLLLGGWCEVYRKDRKYPVIAKVNFDEYNKGKSTWLTIPKTMIRKVAIVQALREAFPKNLGGLYVEEEVEFETLPAQDEPKKQEANTKPLIIKDEPRRPPAEEIKDMQEVNLDEEPSF